MTFLWEIFILVETLVDPVLTHVQIIPAEIAIF
jgi:hypothetical protein